MKTPISSIRRRRGQSGELVIEFGFYMLFMVPVLAGTFTLGMALVKAVEVAEVCRNANVLTVRQINMADQANQKLLVRTARDLGIGVPDGTPDPSGKGVIVISKIIRVGANECAQVTKEDAVHTLDPRLPNTTDCPNYGSYVFAQRIVIGNGSYIQSNLGTPVSTPDSQGNLRVNDFVLNPRNRASGFPPSTSTCVTDGSMPPDDGIVCLDMSKFAYLAEAVFDVSELNIFGILPAPRIYSRNVS